MCLEFLACGSCIRDKECLHAHDQNELRAAPASERPGPQEPTGLKPPVRAGALRLQLRGYRGTSFPFAALGQMSDRLRMKGI